MSKNADSRTRKNIQPNKKKKSTLAPDGSIAVDYTVMAVVSPNAGGWSFVVTQNGGSGRSEQAWLMASHGTELVRS